MFKSIDGIRAEAHFCNERIGCDVSVFHGSPQRLIGNHDNAPFSGDVSGN